MSEGWGILCKICRNASNYFLLSRDTRAFPTPTFLWKVGRSHTPKKSSQQGDRKWRSRVKRETIHYFSDSLQMSGLCNLPDLSGRDKTGAGWGWSRQGEAWLCGLCGACDSPWTAECGGKSLNLIVCLIEPQGERWLQGGKTGKTWRLCLGGVQLWVHGGFETPEGKAAVCVNILLQKFLFWKWNHMSIREL